MASHDTPAEDDGPITSLELELALKKRSGAAKRVWTRIAEERASHAEREAWLTHVSQLVVSEVLTAAPEHRAAQALKALGFYGSDIEHEELMEAIWDQLQFDILAGEALDPPGTIKRTRREWVALMNSRGFLLDKTLTSAIKIIDRQLKKARSITPSHRKK